MGGTPRIMLVLAALNACAGPININFDKQHLVTCGIFDSTHSSVLSQKIKKVIYILL
jgi:hypothetical protein